MQAKKPDSRVATAAAYKLLEWEKACDAQAKANAQASAVQSVLASAPMGASALGLDWSHFFAASGTAGFNKLCSILADMHTSSIIFKHTDATHSQFPQYA